MISNELYDGQGLGNQLWNYAVTRVAAHRKGYGFSILGQEKFKGRDFMSLDFGIKLKGGFSPEGGPPHSLPQGILHYYRERKEVLRDTKVDISRTDPGIFEMGESTKFDGNCQSTKYLEGYRDKILSWIKIKDEYKQFVLDKNACVIHMRCGDFASIKDVFLPQSYYLKAMECIKTLNPEVKFFCVTDEKEKAESILPGVEVIGSVLQGKEDQNKASHHRGGPIGVDFSYLMNATYLIIPNSSFSWWAAYLNTKRKVVVAPKYWARYNTSDGFWSTSDIITPGFVYLDREGKPCTAEECSREKAVFESTHQNDFQEVDLDKRVIPSRMKLIAAWVRSKNNQLKNKIWKLRHTPRQ